MSTRRRYRRPYRSIRRWSDVKWERQTDGSSTTILQSDAIGEVLIVLQRRRRVFFATAYSFLGILIWQSQEQNSARRARRAAQSWWQDVVHGPTRVPRPAPE